MSKRRRKHTREFKLEAVRMLGDGTRSVGEVARDLGIGQSLLCRWRRELEVDPDHAFPGKGRLKPEEDELHQLRKEVERLREERDILKKATAFFAKYSR